MTPIYAIAGWDDTFETCETRKLATLRWWPKPNKHDGLGFRRLAAQRERVDLYCAWALIGDIASRTPRPNTGKLLRGNKPLTAEDLALMTGFPKEIFEKAFSFFSSPDQGWLVVLEPGQQTAPYSSPGPVSQPEQRDAQAASPDGSGKSPAIPKTGRRPDTSGSHPAVGTRTNEREGKDETRSEGQDERARVNGHPTTVGGHDVRIFNAGEGPEKLAGALMKLVDTAIKDDSDLEELCQLVLGKDEMARCGSRWRKRQREDGDKLRRVLLDMRATELEGGRIQKRGAYAEDLFARFK